MTKKNRVIYFGLVGVLVLFVSLVIFFFLHKNNIVNKEKHLKVDQGVTEIPAAELMEPEVVSKVIKVPNEGDAKKNINISRQKITIYIIDDKGDNTTPLVSFVDPENYSPKSVSEAVLLALGERVGDTEIHTVQEEGDSIRIDLSSPNPSHPFGQVTAYEEELVLNCISYSVLDNFTEYTKIYFTMNGEAYSSKNLELKKDKPFINQ